MSADLATGSRRRHRSGLEPGKPDRGNTILDVVGVSGGRSPMLAVAVGGIAALGDALATRRKPLCPVVLPGVFWGCVRRLGV
jgi:hypothetical protein